MIVETCCGHPIVLADCDCTDCGCAAARQDVLDLDVPLPPRPVEPIDLDNLEVSS